MKKQCMHKQYWIMSALFVFLLLASESFATNGHQLSAIGAYQQGMAGAVTAAPYDSSTSISNPAGMAMIGSRTDFSFQSFFPKRELSFNGGGTTEGGSRFYLVPAIGWVGPTNNQGNLFFGGGMYGVSGMGVDYDTVSAPAIAGMMSWAGGAKADIYSQYQFWKMAPTIAWKSQTLALGFALNLDYQAFGFKSVFTEVGGSGQKVGMDLSEMQGSVGAGATIGVIYQPIPAFAIGASYASKQFFGEFKWRLSEGDIIWDGLMSKDGTYKMDLDFPQQAAVGFAIRPIRALLWTLDTKWINYSDTYDKVKLKGDYTAMPGSGPDIILNFGWRDIWVYATALQFDVTPNLALRAGFNYSTSPIEEEDVDNNLAFPAIVKKRASCGFTYRPGTNWEITLAYMKAFKEELTSDSGSGTKISLEESAADIEISYRF